MKLFLSIYITALCLAVSKENLEIVKILLTNEKIDINFPYIFKYEYFNKILIYFNYIQNNIFKLHSKLYFSITFIVI